jgi:hypothetical protein
MDSPGKEGCCVRSNITGAGQAIIKRIFNKFKKFKEVISLNFAPLYL